MVASSQLVETGDMEEVLCDHGMFTVRGGVDCLLSIADLIGPDLVERVALEVCPFVQHAISFPRPSPCLWMQWLGEDAQHGL